MSSSETPMLSGNIDISSGVGHILMSSVKKESAGDCQLIKQGESLKEDERLLFCCPSACQPHHAF